MRDVGPKGHVEGLRMPLAARELAWLSRQFRVFRPLLHDVTLYLDRPLLLAGLSQIIGKLHPHKVIHLRTERLLDPQGHVTRKRDQISRSSKASAGLTRIPSGVR